ncbi:MAG: alpha/beta fold hydrolase [Actinomycetota bacterium]
MRRTTGTVAVTALAAIAIFTAGTAVAARVGRAPGRLVAPWASHGPTLRAKVAPGRSAGRPAVWVAPEGATVDPKPCDDDPTFLCGSVRVPIDRTDPGHGHLRIVFEIFPHTDPAAAPTEPIFVSTGGPGGSTINDGYGWAYWVLAGLTNDHDLVMIDQRGTGASGAIRCPDLQDGWAWGPDYYRATRRCAAKLGEDADRYGSGDVAMDIDDVRQALGYDVIDSFAVSYGTVVQQAYATRYPEHLRAIVSDGGLPVTDPEHSWGWGLDQPSGDVRAAVLSCRRAPTCDSVNPDPGQLFRDLLDRVEAEPLVGRGRDLYGHLHHVVVDEFAVAMFAWDNRNAAELPAAAAALLQHDDAAPLLRLAAENLPVVGPSGSPAGFSEGAHAATYCNDQDFVFDRMAPRAVRRQQYQDAVAALAPNTFAPWSVAGWTYGDGLGVCTEWPSPDRFVPAVPANAPPIDVPTLILSGDIDTDVPEETNLRLAAMYADPVTVTIEGAGHTSMVWSECAQDIGERFLRTLDVGDTSCANTPSTVFQAPPLFPRRAALALEAMARPLDESTQQDRRVAWSAVQTVIDAWIRSFHQPVPVADGAGLRGGRFHVDYAAFPDHAVLELHDARLVLDVAVRGRATMSYDIERPRLRARVDVHGAGTDGGSLRIWGPYWFDTNLGTLRVQGTIGGRVIDVTVPGN